MEPSCVAVFKDELEKLLPHDEDAKLLAQGVYHFAEFFQEFGIEPPPLRRKAFVWGHCHHKATGGIDPETELLKKMGVETETTKAGCCGLAGSWGFEAEHCTGRRALHLAQVLKLAHEHGAEGPPGAWPERLYYERRPRAPARTRAVRAAAAGIALASGAALAWRIKESSQKP